MIFDVQVEVLLRPGIADPAGSTIERSLPTLGFDGVRDVRVISRIDCWGKMGAIPAPASFIAATCPGVAKPIRSPNPKLGVIPNVVQVSVMKNSMFTVFLEEQPASNRRVVAWTTGPPVAE